jgi:hypothetical protein
LSVAEQLQTSNLSCLVVESGDWEDFGASQPFAEIATTGYLPPGYWDQHWIKAVGGTSNVWSGYCRPMEQSTLQQWPLSGALKKYYGLAAAALNRPQDLVFGNRRFFSEEISYTPISIDPIINFGEKYRLMLTTGTAVDIVTGTTVVGIHANEERTQVIGLQIKREGSAEQTVSVKGDQRVILALGGIGNAHILLQPTGSSSVSVGNESGNVGRFLMEHPHVYEAGDVLLSSELPLDGLLPDFGVRVDAIELDDQLRAEKNLMACSIELAPADLAPSSDLVRSALSEGSSRTYNLYRVTTRSEMKPEAGNRVSLTSTRDQNGMLKPKAHFVFGAKDLDNVRETLVALGETFIRTGSGRVRVNNEAIYRQATGGGHIMGTTRMGTDPKTSVVDTNCKLHGYENLYVAGSSIFPTSGAANPTMTIVALAARLADHLKAST